MHVEPTESQESAPTQDNVNEMLSEISRIDGRIRAAYERYAINIAADRKIISEAEARIAPVWEETAHAVEALQQDAHAVGERLRRVTKEYPELLPKPTKRAKTLSFPTGHTWLRTKSGPTVEPRNGEAPVIEEIKAKGWEDFIEYTPTLRKNEMKRIKNRSRVRQLTSVILKMTQKIVIGLPNGVEFIGTRKGHGKYVWQFKRD